MSGEVVALNWDSGVALLKADGGPIRFMLPKEGVETWACGVILMKDAPHLVVEALAVEPMDRLSDRDEVHGLSVQCTVVFAGQGIRHVTDVGHLPKLIGACIGGLHFPEMGSQPLCGLSTSGARVPR